MSQRKLSSRSTWIENAYIITQNAERRAFWGSVEIRDGIFQSVVEGKRKVNKRSTDRSISFKDPVILMPGLIQPHIHLCQTLFRNLADDLELLDWLKQRIWKFESLHTAKSMRLSASLGILELLSSGTTCILDMGSIRHTKEVIDTAIQLGIRGSFGKCLMDHSQNNPSYLQEHLADGLTESLGLFEQFHQTQDDRIRISLAPRFILSCTHELWRKVGEISKKYDLLIHTHASENRKEVEWVKKTFNKTDLEFFYDENLMSNRLVIAHGVWATSRDRKRMGQTGAKVVHCPSSNLKLASGIADVVNLQRDGVTVGVAADGAPCNNNLDGFQEMRLAALLAKPLHGPTALNAQAALDLMTLGGAKVMQWEDSIGSIEVNKQADFILLPLSQLHRMPTGSGEEFKQTILSSIVYGARGSDVLETWVQGKRVYQKSKGFSQLDKVMRLATGEQRRILASAKRLK